MELKFIKANPTENMTLLVESPVPKAQHLEVAEKLISYGSVYAEQVGYIEEAENPLTQKRLQMMAGEFCGNASLSLAAVLAEEKMPSEGEEIEIILEVSGTEEPVYCHMRKEEKGYFGKVEMPLPKAVEQQMFALEGETYNLDVVVFAGISHIIVSRKLWGENAEKIAERAAELWSQRMPPVFGILLFDAEKMELYPLVRVQGATCIWERGCGSGTAAIGVYLAMQEKKSLAVSLLQPGGRMDAEVIMEKGRITRLSVGGKVSIVARGTAYI